jgi:hypothetical protein
MLTIIQESLPDGSTLIPVMLGSDKAQLTVLSGDKKAWPLYLSIGNIPSHVRNAQNQRAWVLIGYIPVVYFDDDRDIQTTLVNRLFHQCVEFILQPLVKTGNEGIMLTDARGDVRRCYPRLAAYIADYPEQILVNVAAGKNSPITLAGYTELDDPQPSPPRTKEWILDTIHDICDDIDPNDVKAYLTAARKKGLNGVHLPFWRELPGYQPEIAVCPDILHGVLRFWRDHVLLWTRRLVGDAEMDRRLRVLQPVIGYKSYSKGISNITQWTGREDRELQRFLIALVAGARGIDAKVMRNLRAFHDFLYLVQYRSHSPTTLGYITKALRTFHQTKQVYIDKDVRKGASTGETMDHFRIPKLAGLHAYAMHIPEMGSSPQYSTEIVESSHQRMAKQPYRATNRKEYIVQMCRFLDRNDRIALQREFIEWVKLEIPRQNLMAEIVGYTPKYQKLSMNILKELEQEAFNKQNSRQHAHKRGLWLNKNPRYRYDDIKSLEEVYYLPDLTQALCTFQGSGARAVSPIHTPTLKSLIYLSIGPSGDSIHTCME